MKNIYQLYIENGCRYGFYVRRNSWSLSRQAKVKKIEGVREGEVISGEPPYYSMPYPKGHSKEGKMCWKREVILEADWFDNGVYRTDCGGNYSWTLIQTHE